MAGEPGPDEDTGDPGACDPIDSGDLDALRREILECRDQLATAGSRREVLEDRVRELEAQVEDLAHAARVARDDYERLASHPVVRSLLAATRPLRRRRS